VRIPSDLHANLGRFFSELKQEILRQACLRAAARTDDDEVCILQPDDVAAIAAQQLEEAAATLEKAFASQELKHVRRAS
jgi:hypothetical protein